MPYFTIEQKKLLEVESAIAGAADARKFKRRLGVNLRAALEPALPIVRGELMAMGGSIAADPPLRTSVANAIDVKVRYSGPGPGVRVSIPRRGMPRGFDDAARKINQGSWAHPVFGRAGSVVLQTGALDFFDRPLNDRKDELRRAVLKVLEDTAEDIARRAAG